MSKGFLSAALSAGAVSALAQGDVVQVRVTAENLSPATSVAFAPLRLGFNNGTFDSFNLGQAASQAIISIAEGGSGADWFPAFQAADPTATLGSVAPGGPFLPGQSASAVFNVDTSINRFFTFGSMVVPSNDAFIGNDSPTRYELFDANGNLNFTTLSQFGRDVWDAGSEVEDPAAAAFLVGGNNDLRTPQNGVVTFNSSNLDTFNGLTTAAGYVFHNAISADAEIFRISFEIVPEPGTAGLLAAGALAAGLRRRS